MIDHHLSALNAQDLEQVEHAIISLGASSNSKAVAPLVRALHRFHQHADIKAMLCDALGELGDLRATQALLSQLRDPDDEVRESAFTALFAIGERRAHAMPNAASWEQGFVDSTTALTQIAWQTDHEAVRLLIQALEGEDQYVKIGALYTLGQLGSIGAFEHIKNALFDAADDVNAAAVYALGELARQGSSQTTTAVFEALYHAWYRDHSGEPPLGLEAQIQVLRAIAECFTSSSDPIAQQQIVTLLVAALDHPEHIPRQLAVIGLGRLGDRRALPVLGLRLQDSESGVRRNAAYAIGSLNIPEGAQVIVDNAAEQSSEVRVAMTWSLKRLPRESAIKALYTGLSSSYPKQRSASAHLLGELGDIGQLTQTIYDPDPDVRKNAVLAIGNAKVSDTYALILPKLDDDDWRVRAATAEALKRLRASQTIAMLEHRKSCEEHSVVRNAINRALKSLKSI